jgi:hypothetical protein
MTCEYTGAIMLKASPQGDKLCSMIWRRWLNTGLFDQVQMSSFDRLTGQVSNSFIIQLDSTFSGYSFSPNGDILYLEYGDYLLKLDQFDLTQFDSISVNNSRLNIHTGLMNFATDLAIGSDGKLYGSNPWGYVLEKDSIPVIHAPDVYGPGCMIQEWGLGLSGRYSDWHLPEAVADFAATTAPEYCWLGFEGMEMEADLTVWADADLVWMRLDGTEAPSNRILKLYSMMGALCSQGQIHLKPASTSTFNISYLPPAPYLLELSAPGFPRLVKPFVKPQ